MIAPSPSPSRSLKTCRRCCWPYLQGLRPAHAPAGSGRCSALAVLPGHSPPKRGRRAKEMRPSPGPRRAKQGNEHTCGTPRRRTHARLIGRQTRPPPGRAVSRSVADRRVTRARKAPRAHWVLGSGDPSTQSVKPQHDRETGAAQSVSGQTKGFSASRAPWFEVACTTSDGRNARFRAHHATLFQPRRNLSRQNARGQLMEAAM